MNKILKVHPDDNLIVALSDLQVDEEVYINDQRFITKMTVPQKHKFFAEDMSKGDPVSMYGVTIGRTTQDVKSGEVATIENVEHATGSIGHRKSVSKWEAPDINEFSTLTFDGYYRSDGKVGTANYWLVIPLVFCENRNLQVIKDAMLKELGYSNGKSYLLDVRKLVTSYQSGADEARLIEQDILLDADKQKTRRVFQNVDGIKFLFHEGGCGGTREDSDTLCRLLAGYINNANVAGATVLSLGCQNAQVHILEESIKKINASFDKPLYILSQQESKSEPDFIASAVKQTFIGMMKANKIERKQAPLDKLTVGLECGGSDGFSGISANPTVGYFSDLLVALGGSVILSEIYL